jgi:hypothetical protein
MSEPMAYTGHVDAAGKFHPVNPGAFKFAGLPFKGKDVIITFEERKNTRSNQQNRAFYGIVVKAFCEYMGYRFASARDKEFVKDQILLEVGHYEIKKGLGGKVVHEVKSTHNLDTKAFKELYEACQKLGAENELVIPDPESAVAMGAKI